MSTQFGALSRNSVVEVEGGHVVLANGDLLLCDGQAVKSLMTQRMRRYLFNSIDPTNYGNSFLALNQPKSEVWICYPTDAEVWPNRAVVWNYKENTFGVRDLPVATKQQTHECRHTIRVLNSTLGNKQQRKIKTFSAEWF